MKQKENTDNKNFSFRFDLKSFLIFVFIFFIEVLIALFVNDKFIRPFGGDILVVMLMYYFVKAFVKTKPLYIIVPVLLFAYMVEFAQYCQIIDVLSIENRILQIVIGSSFSWLDMLCYTVGAAICYFIDRK